MPPRVLASGPKPCGSKNTRNVSVRLKGGGGVIMALTQISRLRFKQSRISMLITHIYVLGSFVNFLVIFRYIWR